MAQKRTGSPRKDGKNKSGPGQIARTLDRGLVVLEALAVSARDLGVTELGVQCGLDKSTVCRMLNTLLRRGYVRQNPTTRQYSLGLKILELYDALQVNLRLQEICRPFLDELVEKSGETSHLAVLSGTDIAFIDWKRSNHLVGVRTQVGRREPAYCTALGKAILSVLPVAETMEILERTEMRAYTNKTVVSLAALREQIKITAERGFATDDEEYIEGVRCVASPVLDFTGAPVGALGLSGPATRISLKRCVGQLGDLVREAALAASQAIGFSPNRLPSAKSHS